MRKQTNWKYRDFGRAQQQDAVREYADAIGVIEPVASVLLNRGLNTMEKASEFFNPDIAHLWDPFLMQDMEAAIEKVRQTVEAGDGILVFGDYDVDGTSGTALLSWFFRDNNIPVHYHIPDRESEGYGLSITGIDFARDQEVKLIITCDCGINAFEEIAYAKEQGIEVIITDHHRPAESLPETCAVLNPNRVDCDYPFKGLCGCGVAFKFAQGMCRVFRDTPPLNRIADWDELRLFSHLDLVALATAADMVPVTGENRLLVSEGMRLLNSSNKPGVRALVKVSGLEKKLKEGDRLNAGNIVFQIAPRINAVGRLGAASRAVDLLITEHGKEAGTLARVLDEENTARRQIERETFEAASYLIQSKYPDLHKSDHRAIVVWEEAWHQGVIGIVASKLKEKYNLPVVVIAINDGIGKGSARSISGFDLYDAFTDCSDYFEGYGGHAMAAGLTIAPDQLEGFESAFQTLAADQITEEMLVPNITLESDIQFSHIGSQLMQALDRLGPYGPGNMRPVFAAKELQIAGLPRIVGENHLKFKAKQGRTVYDAIAFQMGEYYELLIKNEPVDLAFVVERNHWNGQKYIQLNVRDIVLSKDNNGPTKRGDEVTAEEQ